jgi:hypothetical protein
MYKILALINWSKYHFFLECISDCLASYAAWRSGVPLWLHKRSTRQALAVPSAAAAAR